MPLCVVWVVVWLSWFSLPLVRFRCVFVVCFVGVCFCLVVWCILFWLVLLFLFGSLVALVVLVLVLFLVLFLFCFSFLPNYLHRLSCFTYILLFILYVRPGRPEFREDFEAACCKN